MPAPPLFELPHSRKSLRVASFVASLALHFVAVALMLAAHVYLPPPRPAPAERTVAREHKIIWYTPTTELPPVAPLEAAPRPAAAPRVFHPRQNIAAMAKKPESRTQMVLQPAPQLRLDHDVPSPNMLVFNPPPVAAPKPKPRFTPRRRPPPRPQPVLDIQAPQIAAVPTMVPLPPVAEPRRIPVPRFELRQRKSVVARPVISADAPQLAAWPSNENTLARLEAHLPVAVPRFVVPQRSAASAPASRPVLPDVAAPEVAVQQQPATAIAGLNPATGPVAAPRFVVPERSAARGPPSRPVLSADAPAADIAAARQPTTAIVGLNPVPAPIAPPAGSRSASFSAGPESKPEAADSAPAPTMAEVRVPDLAIAPALSAAVAPSPEPALPAPTISRPPLPNTDRAALRRQLLASLSTRTPAGLSSPAKPRGPAGPEIVLHGATVYTMAIDMPNITSHDGSWTLRFTELGGSSPDDLLTAPIAMHKVDPKYIAAAADEGVEGKVLLYAVIRRDGRVDQIRLVQGIDERLDTSAVSAFSKWEFQPATKNGQPADLEAVVQIPFRLGRRAKR